jgi:hypothetical protein
LIFLQARHFSDFVNSSFTGLETFVLSFLLEVMIGAEAKVVVLFGATVEATVEAVILEALETLETEEVAAVVGFVSAVVTGAAVFKFVTTAAVTFLDESTSFKLFIILAAVVLATPLASVEPSGRTMLNEIC